MEKRVRKLTERQQRRKETQDRKEEAQLGWTTLLDSLHDGMTERRRQLRQPSLRGGAGGREVADGGQASGGVVPGADAAGTNGVGAAGQEEPGPQELGEREPRVILLTSPKWGPRGLSSCL